MSEHDPFLDQLNDYIDFELELDSTERLRVEHHLSGCAPCRLALEELTRVRFAALSLESPAPPDEAWSRISSARGSRASKRSYRNPLFGALALAASLVLAAGAWLLSRPDEPPVQSSQELVDMVTEELRAAESHYANAIGGLEQVIQANDGVLSPELTLVLNENLDLIESAIDESRAALRTEPESTVAQESLLEALRRKVTLLQNTILLINEVRKGQGENAMELIDEMREKAPSANPI
jgi:hypothetical protein